MDIMFNKDKDWLFGDQGESRETVATISDIRLRLREVYETLIIN